MSNKIILFFLLIILLSSCAKYEDSKRNLLICDDVKNNILKNSKFGDYVVKRNTDYDSHVIYKKNNIKIAGRSYFEDQNKMDFCIGQVESSVDNFAYPDLIVTVKYYFIYNNETFDKTTVKINYNEEIEKGSFGVNEWTYTDLLIILPKYINSCSMGDNFKLILDINFYSESKNLNEDFHKELSYKIYKPKKKKRYPNLI